MSYTYKPKRPIGKYVVTKTKYTIDRRKLNGGNF